MSAQGPTDTHEDPDPTRPPGLSVDSTRTGDTERDSSTDSVLTRPPETRFGLEPTDGPFEASILTRAPTGTYATLPDAPPDAVFDARSPEAIRGYELIEPLGEGGMGEVWKARQVKLNRTVALKMVLGGRRVGPKDLIRFLAEAEAVAAIRHPHVVQVFEYGDAAGRPFLAMEYLPGGSLTDRLRRATRLAPAAAAALVASLADAVQAAHDQGIVHRDLKPANVLFDEAGQPKVTDFGLAKRAGGTDLTASQAVMGTPAYMAPEQARGDTKFVGPQADVYSLGVILYECLTGTRPFADASQMGLLRRVAEEEPERPGRRVAGLPRDVELIALKCLAKDPAERYATAAELAGDLRRFAAGEPVSVRATGLVERAAKWARRKPTLAAAYTLGLLAMLLAVLLVGLSAMAVWQWRASERVRIAVMTARDVEKNARAVAEAQREKFERFEYGRTMQVAHQEWRENNIAAAMSLLDATRDTFRGWEWRYVHRLCHSDLLTIGGPAGKILSASFSPDGSRILTVSENNTSRVWDARTGAETLALKGQVGGVASAAFSPDGSRIVTASWDNMARVWLAETGAEALTLKGHDGGVAAASFSRDGSRIVTASFDNTARVWLAETGAEALTLKGHSGFLNAASYSPDGSRIVTASIDKTARVWDAKTGAQILTLEGHAGGVRSASFSPDGSRILTSGDDQTARVWDAKTGAEILTLRGHTNGVPSASYSPDGSRIVTAGWDGTTRVWDAQSGAEAFTLRGHTNGVASAAFSPDGSRIVTAGFDNTVKVWDAGGRAEVFTLRGHSGFVNAASFSPDSSRILTASNDKSARVWLAETGAEALTLKGHSGFLNAASYSPDGSRIVTASIDKTARVWDARTGAEILTLEGHANSVASAAFSPDGSRIVTASIDKTARVWDARTGAEILTLEVHAGGIRSASFSPDGSRILTSGDDQTARVWDAKTGAEILTLKGHAKALTSAAFSPDGSRIVTAGWDNTARVWDAQSGAEAFTLRGHTNGVSAASFSPDGSRILTASWDYTARVWDSRSGAEALTLKGHSGFVTAASFSPDGSRIVTAGWDGTARVWDSRSLQQMSPPAGPAPPPTTAH